MLSNIKKFTKEELTQWLRDEAGVNHHSWFGENLKVGGLEIQQVPEEYVEYLWFLKNNKFKNYLNVGIGKGGSFLVETFIQENLESSTAIDNSSYWQQDQKESIIEKIEWLKNNTTTSIEFYDADSKEWLINCNKKFDIIFIDGDHSYEGVKNDYINSLPLLEDNGYMIFHDIASVGCPGVVKLWQDIKHLDCLEFVYKTTCGIGIWKKM
jgi:hypothetical protein